MWIATEYSAAARDVVQRLKFSRAQSAARLIADHMNQCLSPLPPETVVTHIPTATSRVRERGYDQAELIARRLAKLRQLPFRPLLHRHGQTRQVGATRAERHTQLQTAFTCPETAAFANKSPILLVDDVTTTGATIEAAAKVLKKAGAHKVNAALFAQKSLEQKWPTYIAGCDYQ